MLGKKPELAPYEKEKIDFAGIVLIVTCGITLAISLKLAFVDGESLMLAIPSITGIVLGLFHLKQVVVDKNVLDENGVYSPRLKKKAQRI